MCIFLTNDPFIKKLGSKEKQELILYWKDIGNDNPV